MNLYIIRLLWASFALSEYVAYLFIVVSIIFRGISLLFFIMFFILLVSCCILLMILSIVFFDLTFSSNCSIEKYKNFFPIEVNSPFDVIILRMPWCSNRSISSKHKDLSLYKEEVFFATIVYSTLENDFLYIKWLGR